MDENEQLIVNHDKHLRRLGHRDKTLRSRRNCIRRLAVTLDVDLRDVHEDDLLRWQDRLRARCAVKTVFVYSSHVREFFAWMHHVGLVEVNAAAELPLPRIHRGKPRPIPTSDLELAVRCAPEPIRTWLLMMALCGMRCCDIAWLQRDCLSNGVITFETKGGKMRSVPAPAEVVEALTPYLHGTGALWINQRGRPFTADRLSCVVSDFLHSIGLPYGGHSLRHWYATEFFRRSGNVFLTRDVMGHESLNSTMVYVDVNTQEGRDTVAAMGAELLSQVHPLRPTANPRDTDRGVGWATPLRDTA